MLWHSSLWPDSYNEMDFLSLSRVRSCAINWTWPAFIALSCPAALSLQATFSSSSFSRWPLDSSMVRIKLHNLVFLWTIAGYNLWPSHGRIKEWTENDIIISDLQFPIIITIITTISFLTHFCFVTMARTTIYHIPRVLFYYWNPLQKLLMVHILPLTHLLSVRHTFALGVHCNPP